LFSLIFYSVTERAMEWQARVRQTFKRKEIEMALLEFSTQQQPKKIEGKEQERKSKRSKTKSRNDNDGIETDGGSDEENDVYVLNLNCAF
jgi:hypothetical protein